MDQLKEEVIRSMHQFKKLRSMFCMPGISRGKLWLMGVAWRLTRERDDDKARVSDIVTGTGIPAPGVSRILKDLEEEGYLVRDLDKNDRRTTLVTFTEKGECERQKAMQKMDAVLGEVIDGMGEDKVRSLCVLLDAFFDQTELVLSRYGSGCSDNADEQKNGACLLHADHAGGAGKAGVSDSTDRKEEFL